MTNRPSVQPSVQSVSQPINQQPLPLPPAQVSTTGMRIVHGDTCSGIDAVIPDTDGRGRCTRGPCPSWDGGGGGGGGWVGALKALLVLTLLAGGCAVWWVYGAAEHQRDALRSAFAAAAGAAGPAVRAASGVVASA
eukprot:357856-Chlamydomonas_euryale.AAC.1